LEGKNTKKVYPFFGGNFIRKKRGFGVEKFGVDNNYFVLGGFKKVFPWQTGFLGQIGERPLKPD